MAPGDSNRVDVFNFGATLAMSWCLNRRRFLASSLSTAVALHSAATSWGSDDERPEIIDCHTHFYDPTRPEGVPWPPASDPVLYRVVLPQHYRAVAEPLGVTGTVVVEASPWVEDNQWVLDLAEKDPFLVGLVGHLRPGTDAFGDQVRRFAGDRRFRGIRVGQASVRQAIEQAEVRRDLALLAEHDLQLDVNGGPDMPHDVARLAERLPDLRIVINHVANVRMDGGPVLPEWRAGMQAAARHPRVFAKISGLVEGARTEDGRVPDDTQFYRPILDAMWELFGDDRLIYGSNWPVSERFAPYAVVQAIVQRYVEARGAAATRKFFADNARVAYRWIRLDASDS
jgi:L-fuconolactonase